MWWDLTVTHIHLPSWLIMYESEWEGEITSDNTITSFSFPEISDPSQVSCINIHSSRSLLLYITPLYLVSRVDFLPQFSHDSDYSKEGCTNVSSYLYSFFFLLLLFLFNIKINTSRPSLLEESGKLLTSQLVSFTYRLYDSCIINCW